MRRSLIINLYSTLSSPRSSACWITVEKGGFVLGIPLNWARLQTFRGNLTLWCYDARMSHGVSPMNKRSTIYFDPELHKALRIKAVQTERSISDLVNDAVRQALREDQEDLAAFEERAAEPTITYEALLEDLKVHGKI